MGNGRMSGDIVKKMSERNRRGNVRFWWIRENRVANTGIRYKPWRNKMERKERRSEIRKVGGSKYSMR